MDIMPLEKQLIKVGSDAKVMYVQRREQIKEGGFIVKLELLKEGLKLPQSLMLKRKHLRQVMKPREEVQAQVDTKVHEGHYCSTIRRVAVVLACELIACSSSYLNKSINMEPIMKLTS